jgi:phosphotransferase system enzyme I (PtsI)
LDQKLIGVPASPGIAVGPVHLLRWEVPEVRHRIIPDDAVPGELERFRRALEKAKERLSHLRERVERTAGPQEAAIFDVQRQILDDSELIAGVDELIRQNLGAEKAFEIVMFEWGQRFARASHAMLRERVGDLKDVEIRVLTLLLDLPDHDPVDLPKGANAILVTHDLTPSLTVQLDRRAIAGIATDAGTRTSPFSRGRSGFRRSSGCARRRNSSPARRPRSSTARPDCWRSIRRTRTSRRIASARARKSWPKRSCATSRASSR